MADSSQIFLDIENWSRKNHFHFFKDFDTPFFNICANVNVTELRHFTKSHGHSFFLTSLYAAVKTANTIEPFRYRLRGDRVLIHECIHIGSTYLRRDKTFGFAYFEFLPDFRTYIEKATAEFEVYRRNDTSLDPQSNRDDLIYFSVIPWVAFTSFSHASTRIENDSVPRIVFGKYFAENGRFKMPVSVEVHHALADGLHVGQFFEQFEEAILNPGDW